jgi:hypothetical protein
MALATLQRDFLAAITGAETDMAAAHIRGGKLAPAERLAVYANNVASNWRGTLADIHPVVLRLVGPAFFNEAARQYGLANPSRSGDLHRFGSTFGNFLAAYPHARDLPYLADVALLEWACHEVFHAAEAPALDLAALSQVPEGDYGALRFHQNPAVRLVRSAFPIEAIWRANQPDRDGTPERDEGADFVLVSRPELEVQLECLPEGEWHFLAALAAGQDLDIASQAFSEDAAALLGPALQRHVANRTLTGFSR